MFPCRVTLNSLCLRSGAKSVSSSELDDPADSELMQEPGLGLSGDPEETRDPDFPPRRGR